MRYVKLCLGTISILLSLLVGAFAFILNRLNYSNLNNFEIFFWWSAMFFLAGGILAIATRDSKEGAVATTVLYSVGALVDALNGTGKDSITLGALIFGGFALVFFVSIFTQKYKVKTNAVQEERNL